MSVNALLGYYGELFMAMSLFSLGWFVTYTTLGVWLKLKLTHIGTDHSATTAIRLAPLILAHILYSAIFMNPWVQFSVVIATDTILKDSNVQLWMVALGYGLIFSWFLPLGFDFIFLRAIPRWEMPKWLRWNPPLAKTSLATLVSGLISFGAGYCVAMMRKVVTLP